MQRKLIFSLGIIIAILSTSNAQQTGSFTKTFIFSSAVYPNQSRTMAYYVPTNYSATKKYKLFISLGGQGWTPTDDLISPYGPSNPGTVDMLNSSCSPAIGDFIAVSPSISPQAKAAGAPDGTWPYPDDADDGLVTGIINEIKATYNIDVNYVYLTGFSLGARGALYLGLNEYSKLRGLILFTPAVQGLQEAKDLDYYQVAANPYCYYTYANSAHIPIYMTVGASDPNGAGCSFCTPVDPTASYATVIVPEVKNQITAASGGSKLKYTSVAGLGHQRPPASYMCTAYNFIEGFYTTGISSTEENASAIDVFPNPSSGIFNISLTNDIKVTSIEIYNMLGEKIYSSKGFDQNTSKQIDISTFPQGIYNVMIFSAENAVVMKRVVVVK